MNHLIKKLIVGLIAAASVASIAHADSNTPAKPEFVEIDVTVTKDLGETVDLRQSNSGSWFRRTVKTEVDAYATPTTKVSMRTEIDKPSITSARRTIKFRSAMARSNDENYNFDRTSEISVGVDATYIPASNSSTDTAEPAQVLVTIDDLTSWGKFTMPSTLETIELPSLSSRRVYVPIDAGRTNVVKRGDYTVTVTERTVTN
jgi:hypothetical protein